MKKFLALAAVAAFGASATSALALENFDQQIKLRGEVEKQCVLDDTGLDPTQDVTGDIQINPGFEYDFGDISAGISDTASISFKRTNVSCNFKYKLSVKTRDGGLRNVDFPQSGDTVAGKVGDFRTCFPYQVRVEHESVDATLDATCDNAGTVVEGDPSDTPAVGPLSITVDSFDSSTPVAGGQYRELITVRLGGSL